MPPTPSLLEQNALLSGIQLGFALSIFVTLLEIGDKRRIASVTMAAYLIAALLLFFKTYMDIRLLQEFSSYPEPIPAAVLEHITRAYEAFRYAGTWGFLLLVVAIGLTGWIRSKWMGILSTVGAIIIIFCIFRFVGILIGSTTFGG